MTPDERKKRLDKIKKCLRLAASPNEQAARDREPPMNIADFEHRAGKALRLVEARGAADKHWTTLLRDALERGRALSVDERAQLYRIVDRYGCQLWDKSIVTFAQQQRDRAGVS